MKKGLLLLILFFIIATICVYSEDHIIFVAHQNFLSRVYIMRMDGSVVNYYEYSMYYFCDIEVANGEIHLAEAFAPQSFRFDPYTGNIEAVITDLSLYYFYDLTFDGTYFYLTEWDLNRYDFNGNKDGTASFDEDVMGGAWDGIYYWTLNDTNEIKCWDLSGWPTVTEVPSNNFSPPTSACRGLWFDGQYFWTAESFDGYLGNIYKFDYTGSIIDQWSEPAFRGWAACVFDMVGIEETDNWEVRSGKREIMCSPNPFRHLTEIRLVGNWGSGKSGDGAIKIYDASGRVVREISLLSFSFSLGAKVTWDGHDEAGKKLPPGVYFMKAEANGHSAVKKVILVK